MSRIVFHGQNAACFAEGFAELLAPGLTERGIEITVLPDLLESEAERRSYAAADVLVATRFDASLPRPERMVLLHVPGAGYDAIDLAAVPSGTVVCNCFGHEAAIAEYVMAALLNRQVPLAEADRRLRQGEWAFQSGSRDRLHGELAGSTLGILGFGHIGKAVAKRAKAFDIRVHVANRSPVAAGELVDQVFSLADLRAFCGSVDALVVTVPLASDTRHLVDDAAIAAMRPGALLLNVARGPVIEEKALFEAVRDGRIEAVIDTWYRYPEGVGACLPSVLPFETLKGLVMTPHMSGWTGGTVQRRQEAIAENIRRRLADQECRNVVHSA